MRALLFMMLLMVLFAAGCDCGSEDEDPGGLGQGDGDSSGDDDDASDDDDSLDDDDDTGSGDDDDDEVSPTVLKDEVDIRKIVLGRFSELTTIFQQDQPGVWTLFARDLKLYQRDPIIGWGVDTIHNTVIDLIDSVDTFITDDGTTHIALVDARLQRLYYCNGNMGLWNFEVIVEGMGFIGVPALAVGEDGVVHVVYERLDENGQAQLIYSENRMGQWSLSVVEVADYPGMEARVTVDANNIVHLVYSLYNEESAAGYRSVYYANDATGLMDIYWSDEGFVQDDGTLTTYRSAQGGSIAVDPNGEIQLPYILTRYQKRNVGGQYLYDEQMLNVVTGPASTPFEQTILDDTMNMPYSSAVVLDENDLPVIAFAGLGLESARSTGAQWQFESINAHDAIETDLILDIKQEPHVAQSTVYQLFFSEKSKAGWAATELEVSGPAIPGNSAMDADGNLFACYRMGNNRSISCVQEVNEKWEFHWMDAQAMLDKPFKLAVDKSGHMHLIYASLLDPLSISYANNILGQWNPLGLDMSFTDHYDLTLDSLGAIHIVSDGMGWGEYGTNRSMAWENIRLGGKNVTKVVLEIDGMDHVHIAFLDGGDLHYYTNKSGQWKDYALGPQNVRQVAINADNENKPVIVYSAGTSDDNGSLYMARLNSGRWETTEFPQIDNTGQFESLDVLVGENDVVHIGWHKHKYAGYVNNIGGDWNSYWIDIAGIFDDVGTAVSLTKHPGDGLINMTYGGYDAMWRAIFEP